jgi:hypothetical protein
MDSITKPLCPHIRLHSNVYTSNLADAILSDCGVYCAN